MLIEETEEIEDVEKSADWAPFAMSKSARRCGAKHISKSKCTKRTMFGQLLEVEMSKKCTLLWREANSEVKSVKKLTGSEHFVEKCTPLWREAHFEVKMVKTPHAWTIF